MDLPLESEVTEEKAEDEDPDDFDPEALPTRLLAVGPRRDQVMIFKTEGYPSTLGTVGHAGNIGCE
jgi:hypothetical protein